MQERLQKIIARAGVTSRRGAEEMIIQGRVRVNGTIIFALGTKANAVSDHIKVDGKLLRLAEQRPVYVMLHKPKGYMTTRHDPEGRPTVMDLLKRFQSKIYPVGRLDYNSEGLLLLTNDGDFTEQILSAKNKIVKTYYVKINGHPTENDFRKLREGIKIDGRLTAPVDLKLLREGANPWYEITLTQGRKNQIRRMFQRRGFLVEKLKRVKIGPLTLGKLEAGKFRYLKPVEVKKISQLRKGMTTLATEGNKSRSRKGRSS